MNDSIKSQVLSPQMAESRPDDVSILRRVTSDALLAGRREIVIEHSGEEYRLRMTNSGKLILTK